MSGSSNQLIKNVTEILILSYFLIEGLSRISQSSRDSEVRQINSKLYQIETYMFNEWGLTSIEFTWMSGSLPFVTFAAGLIELATVVTYYLSSKANERLLYMRVLACMLLFDICVTHFPLSESARDFGKAMEHCSYDLALLGGLYMLAGFRE